MEMQPAVAFHFRFRLTEGEFRKAHRAYLRRALFSFKNLFLVTIALLIGAVQAQLFGGAEWALRVFGLLWVAIIGLILFVYLWMPTRIYRRDSGLSGDQSIRVDDSGLEWSTDGPAGPKRLTWDQLARASDNENYIYLHPGHGLPWIIPKSAFSSDEQLRAFDRYVAGKLLNSSI